MIIWIRPSGREIETNDLDETVKLAKSLGWKRKQDEPETVEPKEAKPKRKRRTKAEMEAAKNEG